MPKKLKIEETVETHLHGNLLNECMDFISFLKNEEFSFPNIPMKQISNLGLVIKAPISGDLI